MYPYGGRWWRHPLWWTLPRAHKRFPYFKREFLPETYRDRCFRLIAPRVASRLPILRGIQPISYAIPAEKIVAGKPEKSQTFATHIVDDDVARHVEGARSSYAFTGEEEYYGDLQRSRFAITTRRAGWDCLRHYEIAANGTVPCFKDLDAKPDTCAPHGLNHANCVIYSSYEDLRSQIDRMTDSEYDSLQRGALEWARNNSTVERAKQLLMRVSGDWDAGGANRSTPAAFAGRA
jgi:hypothetical protein